MSVRSLNLKWRAMQKDFEARAATEFQGYITKENLAN